MGFPEKLISDFQDRFGSLTDNTKRRIVLIITAAFVVVLVFAVILSLNLSGRDKPPAMPERINYSIPIPADEIFIPDEPDFLPGVILEREQRLMWTEEDASEYWQDPLRYGEEPWREKAEAAIDEFLERVP
jgi:hypothetical protein